MVQQYGPEWSYDGAPRAKIFRRDHAKANSLDQAKAMLRYNGWQWDPLSEGDSCKSISCRSDLNKNGAAAFGGIDCKITDYSHISRFTSDVISGPTYYQ